jgi:hypothetical protein
MSGLQKGLIVGAVQLTLVLSLGAKLRWDRAHLPRVWVKTAAYDPDLFIRGRYLSLRLEVKADAVYAQNPIPKGARPEFWRDMREVELSVENGQLVAHPSARNTGNSVTLTARQGQEVAVLYEPVAFFLPEHAVDPSIRRKPGEELWMEVTVPPEGPPRPIRLAINRPGGFEVLKLE